MMPFWSLLLLSAAAAESECGLYMADSSVSSDSEPRWGLFAGKDLPKGVPIGPREIGIEMFEMLGHNTIGDDDIGDEWRKRIVEFTEQFIWVPGPAGGLVDKYPAKVVAAITGSGVVGGYNKKLVNADWYHAAAYQRENLGGQTGVAHPGRGSSTDFFNVTLMSKEFIPIGSEIFIEYGENWADAEEENELSKKDFERMDAVIDQVIEFMDKYKGEFKGSTKADIYEFIMQDILAAAAGELKAKRFRELLPSDPDNLLEVKEAGGSLKYTEPKARHTLEWLDENGMCFDNLVVGASSIPTAGRGAFAQRPLKKGSLVAPVPLFQIPDASVLDMFNIHKDGVTWYRDSNEVVGKQLILNYCLGHSESNMLFFPAGPLVGAINHSREKANAKLVWSKHPRHHKEWFNIAPEELLTEKHLDIGLGLMMDLVATSDIAKGDEVFIDYGDEWQAAWDKHVDEWNAKVKAGKIPSKWPLQAIDLNQEYRTKAFPTQAELTKAPLPDGVKLACFLAIEATNSTKTKAKKQKKLWADLDKNMTFHTDALHDCAILDKATVDDGFFYNYTIEWKDNDNVVNIHRVPHKAVVFVDEPSTGDKHNDNAFRHFIGIPDDMFPRGPWRNKRTE